MAVIILRILARLLWVVPAAAFVIAAAMKAHNPQSLHSLLSFFGVPGEYWKSVLIGVIGFESLLGFLMFLRPPLGGLAVSVGFALLLFSGLLGYLYFQADPPTCGCFGKLDAFESAQASLLFGVVRNGLLIGFIFTGWLLWRITRYKGLQQARHDRQVPAESIVAAG